MNPDDVIDAEQARQRAALAAAIAPAPVRRYPPCSCAACTRRRSDQAELVRLRTECGHEREKFELADATLKLTLEELAASEARLTAAIALLEEAANYMDLDGVDMVERIDAFVAQVKAL